MYYFVFAILVFFSFLEIYSEKRNLLWFNVAYGLMSFMAIFRYGQLTDYFNYEINYEHPEYVIRDPLFSFVMENCNAMGMSYMWFAILMSALIMALSYPFFRSICQGSLVSLLIFYSYVFLILPMSAIRQALCLAFLLCGFPLLLENRKWLFYTIVIIGGFIHFSMFSVILIGLFYQKKWYNEWYVGPILLGFTFFALVTPDLTAYMPDFLGDKSTGEYQDSRLVQVALRFIIIAPLIFIKPEEDTLGYYAKAICLIGYCLYCFLSFSSLIAGRLEFFFRIFMSLFAASIIFSEKKVYMDKLLLGTIIMIHVVLFFKNMNSFIVQGDYNQDKVNMFNFPYISVFDKDELQNYK